jgi:hypothetical protein
LVKKNLLEKVMVLLKGFVHFVEKNLLLILGEVLVNIVLINVLLMLLKLNIYLMLNVVFVINLFILNLVDLKEVKQKCLLALKNVWVK